MFKLTSAKVLQAATLASVLIVFSAGPASAICRYGSPNCVNPNPGARYEFRYERAPTLDGVADGWEDQDCEHYGNCLSDNEDDGCWYVDGECRPNAERTPSQARNEALQSRLGRVMRTQR